MPITISKESLRQYLQELVHSGRFGSEDEAVEQALELMRDGETAAAELTPELRERIAAADRDIAAGRSMTLDAVRQHFAERSAAAGGNNG